MAYTDLNTIHTPVTDTNPPAAWGTGVRNNFDFLYTGEGCLLGQTAAQTGLTSGVATAMTWDSEQSDTNTMHSTSVSNNLITIKRAGVYAVTANIAFTAHASGNPDYSYIRKNTTTLTFFQTPPTDGVNMKHVLHAEVLCAVNDTLEVMVNCGTNMDLIWFTTSFPNFSATWLRPA